MIDGEENGLYLPPHNIESEQSVLGALLIHPASWDKIAELVVERDFYRAEHQLIFRHIARLIERGEQVDTITVAQSLESTGKLDKLGGLKYLGQLASETPSAANITSYAKIVHDLRLSRDFAAAAFEINTLSASTEEISEKLEKTTEILNRLVETDKNATETLSEATAKALELIERRSASSETISGLKTGFNELDELLCGLQDGDLVIVAGRPSMGKTSFAVNIAENVAIVQHKPVVIFELEMSSEQLALRTMGSQGSVNMQNLRSGRMGDHEWSRLTAAMVKMQDAPIFIDASPGINVTQIRARCRKLNRKHGLRLVIIDYLQLIEQAGGNNRNEDLSVITRSLKKLAKELNLPVVLLSQLNRQVESRPDKRPYMSDLRESGAIEQDADVIAMLYRDEVYNEDSPHAGCAELIVRKQRMGPIGTIHLNFEKEYSRFSDFVGTWATQEKKNSRRGFGNGDDYKSKAGGGE